MAKSSRKTAVLAAVLGAGAAWESRYRPALELLQPRLRVRMVHDPVYNRAVAVAADMGAEVAPSISAVLERPEIDAILLLDHAWYGPAILEMILRAAKPVFIAGEIGHDLSRLERSCRTAQGQGLTAMVEFSRRHWPASYRLRELMATQLGPVRRMTFARRFAEPSPVESCNAGRHAAQVGAPTEQWLRELIGLFDYCVWIAGRRPELISTTQLTAGRTVEPSAQATAPPVLYRTQIQFRGPADCGQSAVSANFQLEFGQPDRVEPTGSGLSLLGAVLPSATNTRREPLLEAVVVECQHGTAHIDGPMALSWRPAEPAVEPGLDSRAVWINESLTAERTDAEVMLDHFCRRLLGGLIPVADLSDAYRGIALAAAWQQSAANSGEPAAPRELPAG